MSETDPPAPQGCSQGHRKAHFQICIELVPRFGVTFIPIHLRPRTGAARNLRCPVGSPACLWFPGVSSSAGVEQSPQGLPEGPLWPGRRCPWRWWLWERELRALRTLGGDGRPHIPHTLRPLGLNSQRCAAETLGMLQCPSPWWGFVRSCPVPRPFAGSPSTLQQRSPSVQLSCTLGNPVF